MRKPAKRTIKIRYQPNPSVEQQAIKVILAALESVRSIEGKTDEIRRIQDNE